MLKALIINCSPVRTGATAEIVSIVKGEISAQYDTKSICIDDYSFAFCRGCRTCHRTAACVMDDDVSRIMKEIDEADVIVSVAPSYWADIPGQFKAFIDRCTPWCDTHVPHASIREGKRGFVIALRTGPGMHECDRIIQSIEHFYGHLHIACAGHLGLTSVEYKEDVGPRRAEITDFCRTIPCRAVIFDLFETLITEWGHVKYTKRKMCADLGFDKDRFDVFWEEKEEERYLGEIDFEGSIRYAGRKLGREISDDTLAFVLNRRMATKAACFEHIDPGVFRMLEELRKMGFRTAIVSNCSSEEVKVIRESELYRYFDEVVLSYEVHMKKPDRGIYEEAARRLGAELKDCIFVGDGGSNELQGARDAGMKAVQAKWYTNRLPKKRETIGDFPVAEEPSDVIKLIESTAE